MTTLVEPKNDGLYWILRSRTGIAEFTDVVHKSEHLWHLPGVSEKLTWDRLVKGFHVLRIEPVGPPSWHKK